ncbi:PDZ domain-containing protein GIPC1 [Stylophora pistillata]|uniref:PDZ domain-containing protein GIPC1 n=2 Tax=Stylophora pistillata TaxID=50429 RepID=A0A2B4SD12_STYPI|nr:PDZ domain-containing protein GIPC1 [Stylophora pistillata]
MPLFKKGGANISDSRKTDGDKKLSSNRSGGAGTENTSRTSTHPSVQIPEPPRSSKSNDMASRTPHPPPTDSGPSPPIPPPKFVFYCQLAHGSATGKVEGFTNVKELYQKIAEVFKMQSKEILFCTLNTYRIDMERLLGGQIGLDDFIFAHVKGQRKTVTVLKTSPALGLTITDNGAGSAFIKRIKEGSIADGVAQICVGDHIEAINNNAVVGTRHYDVARMLRELPVGEEIFFQLVEPVRSFEGIGPRTGSRGGNSTSAANAVGSGKTTLRLRSKGPPVVETEEAPAWELKAAQRIDDLLESFIGIRDPDLAETLVLKSKTVSNPSDFAMAVDEEFADFQFPDDFIFDIWGAVSDGRSGSL